MRRLRSRRGTVALEFALISIFFLLPLMGAVVDGLVMLTAQAQLNTALQALYYYALSDPAVAGTDNTSAPYEQANQVITLINARSVYRITLATPSGAEAANLYYACTATATPSTKTCTPKSPVTLEQIFVQYAVTTSVNLPIPIPGVGNPFPLSASGMIEVQ